MEGASSTPVAKAASKAGKGPQTQGVAPRELPRLATLVHGNSAGIAKLIDAFQEDVPEGLPKPSRAQIEKEIKSMASRESRLGGKMCWYVHPDVAEELGVSTPAPAKAKTVPQAEQHPSVGPMQPALTRPTEVLNPAMRIFLKPQAVHSNTMPAAPDVVASVASASSQSAQGVAEDSVEDAVKTLFTGEASPAPAQRSLPAAERVACDAPPEVQTAPLPPAAMAVGAH